MYRPVPPPTPRPAGYPITGWTPGPHRPDDRSIPDDRRYYITMFGGGNDRQCVACDVPGAPRSTATDVGVTQFCSHAGATIADGTWYYIADSGRFGCGARVLVTNPENGRSVVAIAADVGPHVRVEQSAGGPIIDASPLVVRHLFGRDSYGWSDRKLVLAEPVDRSTPVGPTDLVVMPAPPSSSSAVGVALAALVVAGGYWLWMRRR